MADVEINKPKTEKTSASVTSNLPRLCPTTKLYSKDISCNTQKVKSPSPRNRSISNEIKKRPGLVDLTKTNLYKSKLTEFKNSEQLRLNNSSLTIISPRDYRGSIPIHNRHSLNSVGMSPPVTRSPSPLKKNSPKELKSSNKIKTITMDQDIKKKGKTGTSRSPSPIKRTPGSYKKAKPRSNSPGNLKNPEKTTIIKRTDGQKQNASPRANSPAKRKPKAKVSSTSNVEFLSKEKIRKEGEKMAAAGGQIDSVVLKQASQPSLCKKETILQPQEKISLDQLKNSVYSGDHKRLSFEKVHLCIEKSLENASLAENKRSYLVTYSSENIKKQKEISLAFLQNVSSKSMKNLSGTESERPVESAKEAIRTLSGHEIVLTSSVNLEMEKGEIGYEEISKLLTESEQNFDEPKDPVRIFHDDANEYDSEMSTDGEGSGLVRRSPSEEPAKKTARSIWKSREAELLNDVDYRQSVYHPAVSRRNEESGNLDFRPKSKSIEDNYGFASGKGKERIVRSRSSQLKSKCASQNFSETDDNSNERSWCTSFDNAVMALPIYNASVEEVPIYGSITGVEKIRTKKQRLSGALLKLTLKIIRLLALFNLWPGDFCHMLTSQSLRLAR